MTLTKKLALWFFVFGLVAWSLLYEFSGWLTFLNPLL
jgi:hypothetical protein